jgi:hypothetical protein
LRWLAMFPQPQPPIKAVSNIETQQGKKSGKEDF